MNPDPQREAALFQAAAQLTDGARATFLDGACHGNPALRQRLESLLAADDAEDSFLEPEDRKPAGQPVKTMKLEIADAPDEAVGQTLGRYKLLERVGEGGCGVVYVAEQTEPVRRRVALKVIKLGMDTKQVVARFEAERQALAMMDHPNIAKVLDAGTTDVGRPYFVMELVRGIKITDYCDQANLSTKDRLDLFIKVCQAIQHAHQKGIIHRDIKPSNILVTLHDGVPLPKVIDFGIAKATEGRLTDATVYTQLHQFIGTPAYMSPEQAEMSGLDIDTRSDIYSLGVLLYELLAGSTPFDAQELMSQGIDAMRKTIREKEPVRPSTKLSQTLVAADVRRLKSPGSATPSSEEEVRAFSRRLLQVKETITLLRGDLDWIVMKCLEKDRTRRYETANGLAADLRRHLNNEPVLARPPSAAYKFQKAFRRNKLVFAAGTAIALVLVLGVIGTTIGFLRSNQQRRVAEASQRQARANFDQARAAVGDMLAVADDDLYGMPGMQPLRVKLMRAAIDRYQPIVDQSSTDPTLRAELGRLYLKYGFAARDIGLDYTNVVIPAYDSAWAIQQKLVAEQPQNRTFRADLGWTIIYSKLWHNPSGWKVYQPQAIDIFEKLASEDPKDPFVRSALTWALGLADWQGANTSEKLAFSARRLALLEQLAKEYPRSAEYRRDLANQLSGYPLPGEGVDDFVAKLTRVSRANDLRAGYLADLQRNDPSVFEPLHPRDSEARMLRPTAVWAKFDLANGLRVQSQVLARLTRWPEAISFAERATVLSRELVEENPSMKQFSGLLNLCFENRVQVAERSGDLSGGQTLRTEADNFWRTHPDTEREEDFIGQKSPRR